MGSRGRVTLAATGAFVVALCAWRVREVSGQPPSPPPEDEVLREVPSPRGGAFAAKDARTIPWTRATVRLRRAARVWVVATWDMLPNGHLAVGELEVDGEPQARQALYQGSGRATVGQQYVLRLDAGTHSLALALRGSGTVQVWDHTGYSYCVFYEAP